MAQQRHGDVSHILQYSTVYKYIVIIYLKNKNCLSVHSKTGAFVIPYDVNNNYVQLEIYHNSQMLIGSVYIHVTDLLSLQKNVAMFVEHNLACEGRIMRPNVRKTVLFPAEEIHANSTRIFSTGRAGGRKLRTNV
jgi:hypothetical protein